MKVKKTISRFQKLNKKGNVMISYLMLIVLVN